MKARRLKAKAGGKNETAIPDGGEDKAGNQGQAEAVNDQAMADLASCSAAASTESTGLVIHDDG